MKEELSFDKNRIIPIKELAEKEPYDLQMICPVIDWGTRGDFYDKKNERGRFATVWSDIC